MDTNFSRLTARQHAVSACASMVFNPHYAEKTTSAAQSATKLSLGRCVRIAAIIAASLIASAAQEGIVSWTGATGGDWNTGANWGGSVPVTGDTALFDTTLATVVNAAGVGITNISFDNSAGTGSGTFTLGATGTGAYTLANSGTVDILASLTGTGKTISINAPIVLTPGSTTTAGGYTFANDIADSTNTLNLGGPISASATSSTETLTLSGANTGITLSPELSAKAAQPRLRWQRAALEHGFCQELILITVAR